MENPTGCPCLPYFKAEAERWAEEYATQVAHIKPDVRAQLLGGKTAYEFDTAFAKAA